MSNKLSGRVWELDLDHAESHLLLALADNAHDDGTNCYPSVPYLAWKTGYSERQVQRILRTLDAKGIIRTYRKKVRSGTFQSFTLHLDKAPEKAPFERGDILSEVFPTRGDILSDTDDTMSGSGDILSKSDDKMSPKPLVNPLEESLDKEMPPVSLRSTSPTGERVPPIPMALETEGQRNARLASERQRDGLKKARMR